ncbi:MAG: glycosyltransferase family 39 protein [Caldilineaceae bacterium]|nr:glycosyltransferase family 39 protein [Caldilineaceae bacterium]
MNKSATSSNRQRLLLLALILVAFALRVYRLDAQSLWYDEGVTAEIAQRTLGNLTSWTARDIQPPLYYYLVWAWGRLAGWSEWSLRAPSVFSGVLIVPLLVALAFKLVHSRRAAVVAALIAALHPLLLYYSQEARMYSLLTMLGVLMGVGLLQGVGTDAAQERAGVRAQRWLLYVMSTTAALYTHYFAFFLWLAFLVYIVCFVALDFFRRSQQNALPQPGIRSSNNSPIASLRPLLYISIPLLFYLPWLFIMVTQLSTDASYWQGGFKLWEALRHVLISFTSGETVLEPQAIRLLVGYGLVTLAAMSGWVRMRAGRQWLLSLLWLVLPVAGVLMLALFVPKFNERYVMIGLPGLILLWSVGLGTMVDGGKGRGATGLAVMATTILVAGFLWADGNWFGNKAFTKDQWREAARFVVGHMAADEAVVLVSGHAWPVWHYYAPHTPAVRVPELEILNVAAVLDYAEGAALLQKGLMGKSGAWLVGWQDEVVDPMQVTPLHLMQAGQEAPTQRQFWGLTVRHFAQVDAAAISPTIPHVLEPPLAFGHQLELIGHDVMPNGTLLLFWRLPPAVNAIAADLHMVGTLETAAGVAYARLADRRLAGYDFPTFRWQPEQIEVSQMVAADWLGFDGLPGSYQLRLGVYAADGDPAGLDLLDAAGAPLGKRALLDVAVAQLPPLAYELPRQSIPIPVSASATLDKDTLEPGQPVDVAITWRLGEPLTVDADLDVQWQNADGATMGQELMSLWPALPTSQWPADRFLRTVHRLRAPRHAEPGQALLVLALSTVPQSGTQLPITIVPSTRQFTPPALAQPLAADWAGQVRLLGLLETLPATVPAGRPLELHMVWQAASTPAADYAVTVQFINSAGQPQSQVDLPLPNGSQNWAPDQVVEQALVLDAPTTPGTYRLITALYNANVSGQPRLQTAAGDDFVILGEMVVAE